MACRAMDVEIGTVALACVYFEKLCLKRIVTKGNRCVDECSSLSIDLPNISCFTQV